MGNPRDLESTCRVFVLYSVVASPEYTCDRGTTWHPSSDGDLCETRVINLLTYSCALYAPNVP